MASKPYFVADRGHWYVKWKSAPGRWKAQKLCPHPGWTKGQKPPRRPPPEAVRLARAWEEREAQVRAGLEVDPGRATPLRAFLDDYIHSAVAGQVDGSMKILRRVSDLFVSWCAGQGVTTLPQVTTAVCRAYLAHRARAPGRKGNAGLAFKTLKTERGTLAPAWSQAFQDGRVSANPWMRAPVPVKRRDSPPPFWTEAEVARLVAECRPWLADVVLVGVNTGLRISALLGLEWRDVDFDRGEVRVRRELDKAGKGYRVPMSATANEVLGRRWTLRRDDNPLVFPGPKLGRKVPATRTYHAIGAAVRRSGITDHGRYNHVLRHSFASIAMMRGVPLAVVSGWLGHSSITMTQVYAHTIPEDSQRYMDRFDVTKARET